MRGKKSHSIEGGMRSQEQRRSGQAGVAAAIGAIGWRPDELARLRDLVGGERELTLGAAEDGTPWAALTGDSGHDFHFARIGSVVVGAVPERGLSVRAATLDGVLTTLATLVRLSTR
jgi:hypothetical protein